MKRTFLLQALAGAVLLLGVTVYAGRLLGAAGSAARVDLGGRHPATVPAELRRLLRGLDGELAATLFVSGRERMPSHLGKVGETARDLLEEMEDAAGGRFSYRVIDPGLSGAAGARYAASRRVSPIRVRRVVDDTESQAEIWSSLVFSRQGRPRREDVLVQGIENAHLPHLSRLVTARLSAGESAPQASFALSAPPGYGKFPRYLSQHGPVVEIDVDAGGFIPGDVDVLFWLEPRRVTRRHIAGLRRFLASGRTAVLAGSAYRVGYSGGGEGEVRFRVEGMGSAWERLLEPFGLEPAADLLMDRNSGPVTVSVGGVQREVDAPFHLRNLPAFRDFRPFRTPARGGLSFTAASPLRADPRRVAAAGYQAHVAATTTEHARVRPLPEGEFGLEDLSAGLRVPKQSLMVLLTPEDPWAGQLLVLASASLFRDEILEQPGYGHAVFVRDLARTFADPERLARLRVDRGLPAGLPPLSGGARVGWRLAVAGLVPLVWVVLALRTLRGGVRPGGARHRAARGPALAAGAVVAVTAVVFLALRGPLSGLSWDLTAAGVHTPDDSVVSDLRSRAGKLRAEIVLSPRSQLPPGVRDVTDRLREILSGAGVQVEVRHPVEGRGSGVPAFEVERVQRDTSVTTEIHSGLVLHQDGRSTTIPPPRPAHRRPPGLPPRRGPEAARRRARPRGHGGLRPAAPVAGRGPRGLPEEGSERAPGGGRLRPRQGAAAAVRVRGAARAAAGAGLPGAARSGDLVPAAAGLDAGPDLAEPAPCGRRACRGRHAALQHPAAPVPRHRLRHRALAAAAVPGLRPLPGALRRRAGPRGADGPQPPPPGARHPGEPDCRARVRPAAGGPALPDPRPRGQPHPVLADDRPARRPALHLGEPLPRRCRRPGRGRPARAGPGHDHGTRLVLRLERRLPEGGDAPRDRRLPARPAEPRPDPGGPLSRGGGGGDRGRRHRPAGGSRRRGPGRLDAAPRLLGDVQEPPPLQRRLRPRPAVA